MKKKIVESVTLSGTVDLYHYSKNDLGDTTVLDPANTINNRQFYSLNDYKRSSVPRVFYYTDYKKAESIVKSQFLYKTSVDGSEVLFLQPALQAYKDDKDGFKIKNRKAWEVVDALLGKGGTNWDAMFNAAAKNFTGIYYDTGHPVVNIFKPLKATKYAIG